MSVLENVSEFFRGGFNSLVSIFTRPNTVDIDANKLFAFVAFIIVFSIIAITFYVLLSSGGNSGTTAPELASSKRIREEAIRNQWGEYKATRSFFQNTIKELKPSEQYLVNLQPLTANVSGYIGPRTLGFFSPDVFLDAAIDAGIRSFVLPISIYRDPSLTPANGWPGSDKPSVLYREAGENNKQVKSGNGMTIKQFLDSLIIRFGSNSAQADEPVFVFLKEYSQAVPDPALEEEKYVKLMNDIAKELASVNGLQNFRLTSLGSRGTATNGGENAMTLLLETPLTEFKRKIIFLTDFDLGILNKDAYIKTRTGPSLADYINFRVKPLGGLGDSQTSGQPNIVSSQARQSYVASMSTQAIPGSRINWKDQSRATFLVASEDTPYAMQQKDTVQQAVAAGVQMIPIPFFYLDGEQQTEQKDIWNLWRGGAFFVKQGDARYSKPEPVQPAPANPQYRAAVPGAPPGGIAVS